MVHIKKEPWDLVSASSDGVVTLFQSNSDDDFNVSKEGNKDLQDECM